MLIFDIFRKTKRTFYGSLLLSFFYIPCYEAIALLFEILYNKNKVS